MTASWMRACVPTIDRAPGRTAIASSALALTSALSDPVSRVTPIPSSASSAPTVSRCCRASRSVGANSAPCRPAARGQPPARRRRPRSCPSRRRPGAGAASGSGGRGRRGSSSIAATWSTVSSIGVADPRRRSRRRARSGPPRPRPDRRVDLRGRVAHALAAPRDHPELESEQLVEGEPAERGVAVREGRG